VLVLDYQFTRSNFDTPFDTAIPNDNASLLTAGLTWPIASRWRFFGYNYYNLTQHHVQNEYAGLSYDTCCWALRFIVGQEFTGTEANDDGGFKNQFTTHYYIQFLLKGLGSEGTHNASEMLASTLPDGGVIDLM